MAKRVLHIIKSLGRGGAEMLLPESLKLHDKGRFDFHCIYFLPWKNQLAEAISNAGGTVICMPATNNLMILLRWRAIKKYIEQHEVDLVHAHLPWAGFVARLVHLISKVPVIYTEHNKQERYHWATKWLNRMSFNWQSGAIAVSKDVEASIRLNVRPNVPIYTVLNGVNTNTFVANSKEGSAFRLVHGIPEGAIVVGTVAVFRFQKRLKEWLEIFAQAVVLYPNLYGVIVGDGPLREEVEQQIEKLNLRDKVILAGLQTDVLPWYRAMDIFMMSSSFEGLPVALLEAMSCGCAVVATDAGGIKEVIENKINGYLVPVQEWHLLKDCLVDLVQSPERRSAFSEAGRTTVVNSFSMQRMVTELEALYDSLLIH